MKSLDGGGAGEGGVLAIMGGAQSVQAATIDTFIMAANEQG